MAATRWDAPQGLNKISVKREMAGESEMQNRWEPLVKQVKQEQLPADSDLGDSSEGQFVANTPVKYEAEEWGRDSDSGIVEESPSEFISSTLLKEEESELESDSGISEENTAQTSTQPGHVQSPHEIFLEEEIVWQFTEDPYSTCDPLSTEEEQQQEVPLEVAIKEEREQDGRDGADGGEHLYEDFHTKGRELPPPSSEPHFLDGPPPDGYEAPLLPKPPTAGSAPLEGYEAPPPPPPDYWDWWPHRPYHCSVCVRWFTSLAHLKRHYGTATHKRLALEKGLPLEPTHKRQRRSWKALLAAGSVSVCTSPGSTGGGSPQPPESAPHSLPLPSLPPPPLPSDVGNSPAAQVCPTSPQQPVTTQLIPDDCGASTCGLQPFCPYEFKRQQYTTFGSFESQLCRTPWVPDGPQQSLTLQVMQQQQQQQQYLYQQQEIQRHMQQEQHQLYLQHLQQQFAYPRQPSGALQDASAPGSAVTVVPRGGSVDGTARKTSFSSPNNYTSYRNIQQDPFRIVPHTVQGKKPQETTVRPRQQLAAPAEPRPAPAAAGPRGSAAEVLSGHIEELKSQYPGVTICAAEPKPSPPLPAPPVTATVASAFASANSGHGCPVCGATFTRASSLQQHVQMFHSGYMECGQCGAKIAGLAYFRAHVAEHCSGRPFSCDECPKRFTNRAHLIRHKMLHSGERPYVCHVCGKGFIRKDHMLKHAKVHNCRCTLCVPKGLFQPV